MSISEAEYYRSKSFREALGLLVQLLLSVARGHDNSNRIPHHLQRLNCSLFNSASTASTAMNDLAAAAHDKLQHGFNPESRDRDSAELLFYALRLSAYLLSEDTRERTRADAEHVKLVRAMRQYLKEHDAERNPP